MTINITAPELLGKPFAATISGTHNGTPFESSVSIPEYGVEPEAPVSSNVLARGGKTTAVPLDLVSVSDGRVSPREGGGSYINLTDAPQSLTTLTAVTAAGETVAIEVAPKRVKEGFSDGRHWMLPIDKTTKRIKFELGRFGRKYYVTKGAHGYTRQMIATEAAVSLATVTISYIRDSLIWGRSPEKALEMNLGFETWGAVTHNKGTTSNQFKGNQLLLENGYDYSDGIWASDRGFISRASGGESPLHPMLITSYGSGQPAYCASGGGSTNFQNEVNATWIAFQDVNVRLLHVVPPFATIISHVEARVRGFSVKGGHRTFYMCGSINTSWDQSEMSGTDWGIPAPHDGGLYHSGVRSLLVIGYFDEQSGWRDGYNPLSNSLEYPQPPSSLAHGVYGQCGSYNVTFRKCMISRASSQGIQKRGGGVIEDVFFLDNNMVGNNIGQGHNDVANGGNYPVYRHCVATSAGYRRGVFGRAHIIAALISAPTTACCTISFSCTCPILTMPRRSRSSLAAPMPTPETR